MSIPKVKIAVLKNLLIFGEKYLPQSGRLLEGGGVETLFGRIPFEHASSLCGASLTGSCFRCFHIFSHAVPFQDGKTGKFLFLTYFISWSSQTLMTILRGDSDFGERKMWWICSNKQADSESKLCFTLPFLYRSYVFQFWYGSYVWWSTATTRTLYALTPSQVV